MNEDVRDKLHACLLASESVTMSLHRSIAALGAAAILAGCAGSAQNGTTLPGTPATSPSAPQTHKRHRGSATLKLRIPRPRRGRRARHPGFTSPATKSVSITVNSGVPQVFNTTLGSPDCTGSGSGLNCTFSVTVPYGDDNTISVATFSVTGGAGPVLDQGSTSISIHPGSSGPVSIVLDGVPADLTVGTLPSGTAYMPFTAPQSFSVAAKDAGGDIIVGTYSVPITLHNSDTSGATTIATAGSDNPPAGKLLSSSDTATLDYTGQAIASATISAAATSATGGSAVFVPAPPASPDVYVADSLNKNVTQIVAAGGYATVNTLATGFNYPFSLAMDSGGNIFVSDQYSYGTGQMKEMVAPAFTTTNTILTGLNYPEMVALDSKGDIFYSAFYDEEVYEAVAPAYTTINTVGSGFSGPAGVALDANDNLYVADSYNNAVYEVLAAGGYTTVNTIASGFNYPIGVIVDASGNVFVADSNNNAVKEIVAPAYTTINTLGSGFHTPFGVAVDANDNVYVGDAGNSAVKEILATGGYTTVNTLGSGYNFPSGVWVNNPAVAPGWRQRHRRR
jgi:NHL repeat